MKTRFSRGGFTIVELLVVISIIALLVGILLPAIGKARDAAMTTQSLANVRNLSSAHAAYSADWNDRQWTAIPDDVGLYANGAANPCTNYIAQGGCPPQLILGWDADAIPTIWGYFLGCGGISVGNCGNFPIYQPIIFAPNDGRGTFRLSNVESFNSYVSRRFYDKVWYAPKDNVILGFAEKYFALPDEFTVIGADLGPPAKLWLSSYCLSPAGMWAPEVLRRNQQSGLWYTNPASLAGGYRSPTSSQSQYPDLKTRILEHHWLQQKPNSDVNYFFAGGETPWYFNHGFNSAPVTCFYDGSVRVLGVGDAMDADSRARGGAAASPTNPGLWSRDTPYGQNGYFYGQRYDFIVNTSFHILTLEGILGRDIIGVK
ncbi:MAG TPA: type II secretion system protein [Phycisphaerales bacterium]|nr:type II secretion system protein [Phycisphaerales bacterium]HMP36103.1 type II secretion system protein [Phycisphaerales bacterium]